MTMGILDITLFLSAISESIYYISIKIFNILKVEIYREQFNFPSMAKVLWSIPKYYKVSI